MLHHFMTQQKPRHTKYQNINVIWPHCIIFLSSIRVLISIMSPSYQICRYESHYHVTIFDIFFTSCTGFKQPGEIHRLVRFSIHNINAK